MAQLTRFPWIRHLRSEPTAHVLRYQKGELTQSGRGLSFWFLPMTSAVAEVPVDTRELPFLVHGISADFQPVAVQGEVHYRVADPELLGGLVDFSIDLDQGAYLKEPLNQLSSLLVGQCQQIVVERLAEQRVRDLLSAGPTTLKQALAEGMLTNEAISEMGIEVHSVRVSSIRPSSELQKALQTPTRERLQQEADQATFERRAVAVEKERAIAENELKNQIELARREKGLIAEQGQNARHRAEEEAAAEVIRVDALARSTRVEAEADAERIRIVDGAQVVAEGDRIDVYRELAPAVIIGLAARELAGKLDHIEHLNITPDLLSAGLNNLLQLGNDKLSDSQV